MLIKLGSNRAELLLDCVMSFLQRKTRLLNTSAGRDKADAVLSNYIKRSSSGNKPLQAGFFGKSAAVASPASQRNTPAEKQACCSGGDMFVRYMCMLNICPHRHRQVPRLPRCRSSSIRWSSHPHHLQHLQHLHHSKPLKTLWRKKHRRRRRRANPRASVRLLTAHEGLHTTSITITVLPPRRTHHGQRCSLQQLLVYANIGRGDHAGARATWHQGPRLRCAD